MRVAIWADMEGVSGIDDIRMCASDLPDYYRKGQELGTGDVNAAIEGIRKVADPEIDVYDGHGGGGNLLAGELAPGANYVINPGFTLWKMIKTGEIVGKYDALVMLGMHAMSGTRDGFITHTNWSTMAMKINGSFVGEIAQVGWQFGLGGTPTIAVAGDDAAIREALAFFPSVKTAVVKNSKRRAETVCLPLEKARAEIVKATFEAMNILDEFEVYTAPDPVKLEILFAELGKASDASIILPRTRQVDDMTIACDCDDFIEATKVYQDAGRWANQGCWKMLGIVRKLDGAKEMIRKWVEQDIAERLQRYERDPPFPIVKY